MNAKTQDGRHETSTDKGAHSEAAPGCRSTQLLYHTERADRHGSFEGASNKGGVIMNKNVTL